MAIFVFARGVFQGTTARWRPVVETILLAASGPLSLPDFDSF